MNNLNSTGIKPLVLDEIIENAKKYKVEKSNIIWLKSQRGLYSGQRY